MTVGLYVNKRYIRQFVIFLHCIMIVIILNFAKLYNTPKQQDPLVSINIAVGHVLIK